MTGEAFDAIVLGAGAAGCVLAARLSEDPARRVLVLEAGRAAPEFSDMPAMAMALMNTEVDWSYHSVPQPGCRGRRIYLTRGKALGGSSAVNAMIYIRGLPSDYDGWAAIGCPGWGWADVLPAFLKSEDNPRHGPSPLHGRGGPLHVDTVPWQDPAEHLFVEAAKAAGLPYNDDFNGERQEGVGWYQQVVKGGERWGAFKAFLRPAMSRPNLTVRTGVLIHRILIERGRAVGVEYLRNGRPETVRCDGEIVLAAGAIGSPQILMHSGVGPADHLRACGVAPVHDLPGVGLELQDHLIVALTFHARAPVGIGALTESEFDAALETWRASRGGPISSTWCAAGAHVRSAPEVGEPDLQLYGYALADRDHGRYLSARTGFTIEVALQRPRSRGSVRLRSADPAEHPAIDLGYFASDPSGEDLATLVRGLRLARGIAAAEPLASAIDREITPSAEATTDAELADYVRGHCNTLYHLAGTCRMGSDAGAVVDPALRVRGVEGLRVADVSVFPKMVSGNTQAPTIMVAERCAEMMGAVHA